MVPAEQDGARRTGAAELTPERWAQVKVVFEQAVEQPPESWDSFIESATPDELVRREVARLLRHDRSSPDFLTVTLGRLDIPLRLSPAVKAGDVLLGRFALVREAGSGGMGRVFEARDLRADGERIAIKTLHPHLTASSLLRDLFRDELLLARKVTHPNICRVHELFEAPAGEGAGAQDATLLITMEFLEGENLRDRLERAGAMEHEELAVTAVQIAEALAAAHKQKILHCDLKSRNVLLCRNADGTPRAVVTDFGLARSVLRPQRQGFQAGTTAYMAPELFAGEGTTYASDVYAYGVLLQEMLTGKKPQAPLVGVTGRVQPARVETRAKFGARAQWEAIVRRCLAADPNARYGSGIGLLEAVRRAAEYPRRVRRRIFLAAGIAAAAGALTAILPPPPARKPAVAILPFSTDAGAKGLEHLAVSLPEELIRELSRLPGVRVTGRNSAFQAGFSNASVSDIARELKVESVVRGRVGRSDGTVAVDVAILNGETGAEQWKHEFRRPEHELLALREDLLTGLASALPVYMTPQQTAAMHRQPTQDADAYNLYLLGVKEASSRTVDGLARSVELFTEALERDPKFALACTALASSQTMLAGRPGYPAGPTLEAAERNALRSLAMDETLAETHLACGAVRQRLHWDWAGAEKHFRRSIELHPGLATGHHWLAGLLSNLGRAPEALAEIRIARELDPLSLPINTAYGAALLRTSQTEAARRQLEFTARLSPQYPMIAPLLGETYAVEGRWGEAVEAYRKAVEQNPGNDYFEGCLAFALLRAGRAPEAVSLREKLERAKASAMALAVAYAGERRVDDAVRQLEIAYERRDPRLAALAVEPLLGELRGHKSFVALLEKLNLR